MGNNSSGFKNEKNIKNAINGKKFEALDSNLKQFISFMHEVRSGKSDIICEVKKDQGKSDIQIIIEEQRYNVSIKEGEQNSVHQEKVEEFVEYAQKDLDMTSLEAESLKKFIYGDGTSDGSGERKERKKANVVAKEMKKELIELQHFFDRNKEELIQRFVIEGTTGTGAIDYLYYGTPSRGITCNTNEIYKIHDEQRNRMRAALRIGNLSLQAWKRALPDTERTEEGWEKADKDRGQIQIKWSSLEEDLNILRMHENTVARLGEVYEYSFGQFLNKNKDTKEWEFLKKTLELSDTENVYAIKVKGQKHSFPLDQSVNPKTDVYLARLNIDKEKVRELNYDLDEKNIKDYFVEPILKSGISVKMKASSNYTICKICPKTFGFIFGDSYKYLGLGCTLFSQKEEDMIKNENAFSFWNLTKEDIIEKFTDINGIERLSGDIDAKEQQVICQAIKAYSKKMLIKMIKENDEIRRKIFKGEGIFSEPYQANYMFAHGILAYLDINSEFSITSASGRTKNSRFDLVIKPKS